MDDSQQTIINRIWKKIDRSLLEQLVKAVLGTKNWFLSDNRQSKSYNQYKCDNR